VFIKHGVISMSLLMKRNKYCLNLFHISRRRISQSQFRILLVFKKSVDKMCRCGRICIHMNIFNIVFEITILCFLIFVNYMKNADKGVCMIQYSLGNYYSIIKQNKIPFKVVFNLNQSLIFCLSIKVNGRVFLF
jgi:hypothetical protein